MKIRVELGPGETARVNLPSRNDELTIVTNLGEYDAISFHHWVSLSGEAPLQVVSCFEQEAKRVYYPTVDSGSDVIELFYMETTSPWDNVEVRARAKVIVTIGEPKTKLDN